MKELDIKIQKRKIQYMDNKYLTRKDRKRNIQGYNRRKLKEEGAAAAAKIFS